MSTNGFALELNLLISEENIKFDQLRDHKLRYFKQEDIAFAKQLQPTVKGNCIDCSYNLIITREFDGAYCSYDDPKGIEIPITINPGVG